MAKRAAGGRNAPVVQTSSLNSSKQASGPEQWMPPVNQCAHIAQWTVVKAALGMTVDKADGASMVGPVECGGRISRGVVL